MPFLLQLVGDPLELHVFTGREAFFLAVMLDWSPLGR